MHHPVNNWQLIQEKKKKSVQMLPAVVCEEHVSQISLIFFSNRVVATIDKETGTDVMGFFHVLNEMLSRAHAGKWKGNKKQTCVRLQSISVAQKGN